MIFHLLLLLIRILVYKEITGDANKMNFANIPDNLRHVHTVSRIHILSLLPPFPPKKKCIYIHINMK